MPVPSRDDLAHEFDVLMARAGIAIPAQRRPGILTAYADLRGQIELLHAARDATVEPANVYRLTSWKAGR